MELKKLISPFLFVGLFSAFGIVCLMVWVTKGKNARWIAGKMKIGGLILTLTAFIQSCDPAQTAALIDNNPLVTCYDVNVNIGLINRIFIQSDNDSTITLNLQKNNKIEGEIQERNGEEFSFAVFDLEDSVWQKGDIQANDGKFDEDKEAFQIEIDKSLSKGNYLIRFYMIKKEDQPIWSEQYFKLKLE